MADTIYIKGSAKQMQNGATKYLQISVNKDDIASHANEKGYVNINIFERKEPSQFGDTHNLVLHQYKTTVETPEEAAD